MCEHLCMHTCLCVWEVFCMFKCWNETCVHNQNCFFTLKQVFLNRHTLCPILWLNVKTHREKNCQKICHSGSIHWSLVFQNHITSNIAKLELQKNKITGIFHSVTTLRITWHSVWSLIAISLCNLFLTGG